MTEVAKLTAPITVKIPFAEIQKFQDKLDKMADTLEIIVRSFNDVTKAAKQTFNNTNKSMRVTINDNKKIVKGNELITKTYIRKGKAAEEAGKKERSSASRTAKAIGGLANIVAKLRVALGLMAFAAELVFKTLAVPAAALAGLTIMGARVNKNTTQMVLLSEAVGSSHNEMKALTLAAKELGFTFENVNPLFEEWNNKIKGEKAGFKETQLREGLEALGMSLGDVIDLNPDEAFGKIMDAGKDLADSDDLATFSSAVDKIYGQEANRLMSAFAKNMSKSNKNYRGFIKDYARFTSLTKEAQKGALSFTRTWNKGLAMIGRGFSEFFGTMGSRLAPFERQFETFFVKFFSGFGATKDEIQDLLHDITIDTMLMLARIKVWAEKNEDTILRVIDRMKELSVQVGKLIADIVEEDGEAVLKWLEDMTTLTMLAVKAFRELNQVWNDLKDNPFVKLWWSINNPYGASQAVFGESPVGLTEGNIQVREDFKNRILDPGGLNRQLLDISNNTPSIRDNSNSTTNNDNSKIEHNNINNTNTINIYGGDAVEEVESRLKNINIFDGR